jgi:AmiR/NasT family two-component response regulator
VQDVAVLVVAKHAVVSALVGLLVELAGHRPVFPDDGETPLALLERVRPRVVFLDCAHEAATRDEVYQATRVAGGTMILFSPARTQAEVEQLAAQYGVRAFVLPISFSAFKKLISLALASAPGEAAAGTRAASHGVPAQPSRHL